MKNLITLFAFCCFFSANIHGQILFEKLEKKENTSKIVAQYVPIDNPPNFTWTYPFYINLRDNLGDFEKWENLHLFVGDQELEYHIDYDKRSITLEFRTEETGYYSYEIKGKFLHNDGYIYTVEGDGLLYVGESAKSYDFYAYIDEVNKTATAFFQEF